MAENDKLTHDRKHPLSYSRCWTWEKWEKGELPNQTWCWKQPAKERFVRTHYDWGFGLSDAYFKKIVDDKRYKLDWKWNLRKTWEVFKGGARFYGGDHISKTKKRVVWEKTINIKK